MARRLRRTMTDAERRLWSVLRSRRLVGYKFRRQHPAGPYILDFACLEHRLVVEADGSQHADSDHDKRRTAWLERRGWRVVRFWNADILRTTDDIAETILAALGAPRWFPLTLPSCSAFGRAGQAPPSPARAGEGLKKRAA